MAARHIAEGAELLCGVGLASIVATDDGVRIELADGRAIMPTWR